MISVAASLFAPPEATTMTGQTSGPADMPAFGTLLTIDPVAITGGASVQATMSLFGALPGAAPTPVIPAPPMTTLLTIASVAETETPPAVAVVQPAQEPVAEAPVPPTESPAAPTASAPDMPVLPKAAPKDQAPPAAPARPAAAAAEIRPEALPIISTQQLPAQASAPVIAAEAEQETVAKSDKPEAAPSPDELPLTIVPPLPIPQPVAVASPVPVSPPVERMPADTRTTADNPSPMGPTPHQPTSPALRDAVAVDKAKYDVPVEQQDGPTMPVDAAPPSTASSADPAPQRDSAPAFATALAPHTVPAETTPKPPIATITAQPGRIGQELGVAIAHHVASGTAATGGGETITLRLNPVDMGRIEVKLSFDDSGTLRAVVSADTPAALEMLRRDSADLGRALSDAGVRADTQTLRFDTRAGDGQRGQANDNGPPWQRQQDPRAAAMADTGPDTIEDITAYRPLRTRGGVDLVA